ncbi:MAG TPA: hypothetical protein VID03_02645 [Acidimicrobiia bacterium]
MRRLAAATALVMTATACSPAATTTSSTTVPVTSTTTTIPPTTVAPSSTTTQPTTTTAGSVEGTSFVLPATREMGPAWEELFVIPYGVDEATLGTAPGGEGLMYGPEYGAQAPDGTWAFLDAAKQRIAYFSEDGEYLNQVPIGPDLLVDGQYFQYQLPRFLDDGTLIATGFRGENSTAVLMVKDGMASEMSLAVAVIAKTDDGSLLYGFDTANNQVEVDLAAATVTPVEFFRSRTGDRYRLTLADQTLHIEQPDADPPSDRSLAILAPDPPGGGAFASAELASGVDGDLYLFMLGIAQDDESLQLGGYTTIHPDGGIDNIETVRDPFSPSDPGSPSHLGVRPGTNDPWLMFIDEDGARVFGLRAP